jgi:uncharacterized protein YndB with AHSA1/START domain
MSTAPQQPAAVADTETFTITRTIRAEAPVDRVWQALTQEEHITRWFGQRASLPDLRVGGEGSFGFSGYGDFAVRIDEYDEPVAFAFTWGEPVDRPDPLRTGASTQVRFTLEPDGAGTRLTVVETGFGSLTGRDPRRALEDNREGWTSELDELVAYLEHDTVRSA